MNVLRRRWRSFVLNTVRKAMNLSGVDDSRGWRTLFSSGDGFQTDTNGTISDDNVLRQGPVYACHTLIMSDVGKVCLRMMKQERNVWVETQVPAFSPLLRKPNDYQTRQQFIECWVGAKLTGNAYIYKQRHDRNTIKALHVLDSDRVTPLIAPNGDVYYGLQRDDLCELPRDYDGENAVPASEIIHDRMECLFHPLVGISPLFAANLPAAQALRIQTHGERFFRNMSRPSGVLTSPRPISDSTAQRIKAAWEDNFRDNKMGGVAVVGDDLKYIPMQINASDSQLVEQLKLSAEQICSAYHVPPYMIGAGPAPPYNSANALRDFYYSQCLQKFFNAIEDLLDLHLNLYPLGYRTEFELDDLLRMDSTAQADFVTKLVGGAVMTPNEGRKRFAMLPVDGGDTVYLQQQNYSLEALAKRDAQDDPFAAAKSPALPAANDDAAEEPEDAQAKASIEAARLIATFTKGLEHV